jgi:phytoene/squalene synthetase
MLAEQATPENLIWSDSICTGLQLANFWQDVARDAEIGRIYLPASDRHTFGYTDAQFAAHRSTPEFQALLKFEVDRARDFLLQGKPLIRNVPGRLRIDFDLFLQGGLLILDAIEQVDYQVWERRPVLRKSDFAKAALRSLWRCCLGHR